MVINKVGAKLYDGLVETVREHLRHIAGMIEQTQGQAFMAELKLKWDQHNKAMSMIRDILMVCPVHTCILFVLAVTHLSCVLCYAPEWVMHRVHWCNPPLSIVGLLAE
jgi:hypothetical protein